MRFPSSRASRWAAIRFIDRGFKAQRRNAAKGPHGKEAHAAGITAVGGNVQHALQRSKQIFQDAVAGNALEIKISAASAMNVKNKRGGNQPAAEAYATGAATPGTQTEQTPETILDSAALRAPARTAIAFGAKQFGVASY